MKEEWWWGRGREEGRGEKRRALFVPRHTPHATHNNRTRTSRPKPDH
jgi:hypothetical protein